MQKEKRNNKAEQSKRNSAARHTYGNTYYKSQVKNQPDDCDRQRFEHSGSDMRLFVGLTAPKNVLATVEDILYGVGLHLRLVKILFVYVHSIWISPYIILRLHQPSKSLYEALQVFTTSVKVNSTTNFYAVADIKSSYHLRNNRFAVVAL